MRPHDFFKDRVGEPKDAFGSGRRQVSDAMFVALRRGPLSDREDVEVAPALASLIHDDLEDFGTGGSGEMTADQMRHAILALRAVTDRMAVQNFDLPFRDYTTFKNYWVREGAAGAGGYQARRNLLSALFDGLHDQLADLETRSLSSSLVDPISPHSRTGWGAVDTEISELRRHFQNARTPQDYSAVGNDCVRVTEALSRQVYDVSLHLRPDKQEPPVANTKDRLDRCVEVALPGPDNARLRKLVRATIEVAQEVKHRGTPTRREAGIAADSVIQLANVLRRLHEPGV